LSDDAPRIRIGVEVLFEKRSEDAVLKQGFAGRHCAIYNDWNGGGSPGGGLLVLKKRRKKRREDISS
jgi:hypothetical protein